MTTNVVIGIVRVKANDPKKRTTLYSLLQNAYLTGKIFFPVQLTKQYLLNPITYCYLISILKVAFRNTLVLF